MSPIGRPPRRGQPVRARLVPLIEGTEGPERRWADARYDQNASERLLCIPVSSSGRLYARTLGLHGPAYRAVPEGWMLFRYVRDPLSGSRLPVDCCQPRCLKVRNRTQVLSTRIYPNSFLKPGSTWAVATSAMIPRAGIVVFEILDFEILARGARN